MYVPQLELASPVCPVDVCYEVKPLQQLCARVVGATRIAPEVPSFLTSLVQAQEGPDWLPCLAKDRSCSSVSLKVGTFEAFPHWQEEAVPEMFSIDLCIAAQNTLRFLQATANVSLLQDTTCVLRYEMYLDLHHELFL